MNTNPIVSKSHSPAIRIAFAMSVVMALSGCAPGVHFGSPHDVQSTLNTSSPDQAPPGSLIEISTRLLSEQATLSPAMLSREVKQLFGDPAPYTIGPGDILNIVVWDHPELALTPTSSTRSMGSNSQADIGNGYNVSSGGAIQFPYVGVVKVAGMTELQVRELLVKRLASYINNPQVTVRIQSYRNRRVYIDGEVRQPGLQVMDDLPMTLPEALNRAGGFTPDADRSSVVLTRSGQNINISLPDLISHGINPAKILLANGDVLRVLNRDQSKVFVLGEIIDPSAQRMFDGKLSLGQALGQAGGLNPLTAQPSQVYVVRKAEDGSAHIYHLDASQPAAFVLANDFQLKPHDLVYVDPAPVVRWQRVISNILPSYGAIATTQRTLN